MWRTALLLMVSSSQMMVGAQQLKSFGVDGATSSGGMLIYKGKSYIALDLLQQAGATSNSKTLFIYTQPIPGGPALKLTGCANQKMYNNAFYLTVQAPRLEAGDSGQGAVWQIPITVQPVTDLRIENSETSEPDVDLKDAVVTFRDGSRFAQRTTPLALATSRMGTTYFPKRVISQGTLFFQRDMSGAETNPPVKLSLPVARVPYKGTFPGMSIDLTCTR